VNGDYRSDTYVFVNCDDIVSRFDWKVSTDIMTLLAVLS